MQLEQLEKGELIAIIRKKESETIELVKGLHSMMSKLGIIDDEGNIVKNVNLMLMLPKVMSNLNTLSPTLEALMPILKSNYETYKHLI